MVSTAPHLKADWSDSEIYDDAKLLNVARVMESMTITDHSNDHVRMVITYSCNNQLLLKTPNLSFELNDFYNYVTTTDIRQ